MSFFVIKIVVVDELKINKTTSAKFNKF